MRLSGGWSTVDGILDDSLQPEFFDDVHRYWFGDDLGPTNFPHHKLGLWFGADSVTDDDIRDRFGTAIDEAAAVEWDVAKLTERQRVGLVVLIDQFPRNAYRGTPRVYRHDARAAELARQVLATPRGTLTAIELMFACLPLGHSERLEDQDEALEIFVNEIKPMAEPNELWARAEHQARSYRDIVARFGRFPHRNSILGRPSTPEEDAFLNEGPASGSK